MTGPGAVEPGQIIILNGAPRSGKSSIAEAIQASFDGPWLNLGVDVHVRSVTPARYRPGIGLRPGGERPDLEPLVAAMFAALYDSVAAHSRHGLNVVVDVGHHDAFTRPLRVLPDAATRLAGLPVLFVGVRCPIEVVMQRRDDGEPGREGEYATREPDGAIPAAVRRWEREVHRPGHYDLEVDTAAMTPEQCADVIGRRLKSDPRPSALADLRDG